MKIYNNEEVVDLNNILFTDLKEEIIYMKNEFSEMNIDFSHIHELRGDKDILEVSFNNIKYESLND
jgi:hypothetical protein